MSAQGDELTPINVVPHFSRLHEWVALEEGYFRDVSLEPNMLADVMHSVSSPPGRRVRPTPPGPPLRPRAGGRQLGLRVGHRLQRGRRYG
jgi:hypothetical protein